MKEEISVFLKNKRKEYHLTQEKLATKLFVSKKSISNWETGKNFPDIDSLIRMSALYGFSLDELLKEGAPIVNDIKNKTEIKTVRLVALASLLTNSCFLLMIATQKWFGDLSQPALLFISLGIFSNFVPLVYFINKRNKLKVLQPTAFDIVGIIVLTIISIIAIMLIPKMLSS